MQQKTEKLDNNMEDNTYKTNRTKKIAQSIYEIRKKINSKKEKTHFLNNV